MKKIWMMMAMAAIFTACSNEDSFNSQSGNYILTGYADAESRTAFGTPGTNSIPFVWSAGDKIWADSEQSNAIATGGSSATFTFQNEPSGTVYYNMTGSSATKAHVKAEQTVGNLGENGDFGYATISNGSFTLSHATAYLWFDITAIPQDATLQSITFDAGETIIVGEAEWNGSSFGTISNGSSSIQLNVNKAAVSGAETAMVVFPVAIESASVTYQLSIDGTTKYYKQSLGAKTFEQGTTYKVSVDLATAKLYELRVLTFEDSDAKFASYTLEYASLNVTKWSDLIPASDEQAYGASALIYGPNMNDAEYEWKDEENTLLYHKFPYNYDGYAYSRGGAVVSSHLVSFSDLTEDNIYNYQVSITAESGNNSSKNFCVVYNSSEVDPEVKTSMSFADNKARVIDHMYVTIAAPTHYCITYGNQFSEAYDDDDFLKLIATGIKADDSKTESVEIVLAQGVDYKITDWTKWDLSSLGEIKAIEFHMEEVQIDDYGYGKYYKTPLYFAFDDVAVQFTE